MQKDHSISRKFKFTSHRMVSLSSGIYHNLKINWRYKTMKKKIFAITLCALIAAASIVGSTQKPSDNSYEVAKYILDDISGGY